MWSLDSSTVCTVDFTNTRIWVVYTLKCSTKIFVSSKNKHYQIKIEWFSTPVTTQHTVHVNCNLSWSLNHFYLFCSFSSSIKIFYFSFIWYYCLRYVRKNKTKKTRISMCNVRRTRDNENGNVWRLRWLVSFYLCRSRSRCQTLWLGMRWLWKWVFKFIVINRVFVENFIHSQNDFLRTTRRMQKNFPSTQENLLEVHKEHRNGY